ncbi:low affinity immunoglobulin epsilon Fc receptor-like [Mya arenaria]|uniref:low affinity immunoglobulin epsilon Fc receptor-like n=1 Tax=Mya arenaria TaxID=6604 RepID=UPI0022E97F7C|nr:low affinity immunoglobulin epsilon Fc receptor-like [Mya arenaria]
MAVYNVGVLAVFLAAMTTAQNLNQLSKKVNLLEAKVDYEMLNLKQDIETVVANVSAMMSGDFCGICVNNTNTVLTKSDAHNSQGGLTRREKSDTSQGFKLQIRQAFAKEKLFLGEFNTDITEKTTRMETKMDDFNKLLRESDSKQEHMLEQMDDFNKLLSEIDSKQEHMLERAAHFSEGVDALNASLNESNENTAHLETEVTKMKNEIVKLVGTFKDHQNTLTSMYQNYESMKSDVNYLKTEFSVTSDSVRKILAKGRTVCSNLNGKTLNKKCYVKLDRKYNFEKAAKKCSELIPWGHSKLVEIESKEENDFVARNFVNEWKWLGGSDKNSEGTWYWISDERVWTRRDFKGWDKGEPNDNNNGEDCLHTHANGAWNDVQCHFELMVVCEFKLDWI